MRAEPDQGVRVVFEDWTTVGPIVAVCGHDSRPLGHRCLWEFAGGLLATNEKAAAHVAETGHRVDVHMESERRVRAALDGAE